MDPREIDDEILNEIRRAAFELRHDKPQEAVRILRRCAAQGGGAEVLARGALGEIYLEEFGDLDGAESEFKKVLAAAPGLAAAELGLARVLREQGRDAEAEAGFSRAIAGLLADVSTFRAGGQPPPGAEEVVLGALEIAIELCELRARKAGQTPVSPMDESALEWAAAARLFDALGQDEVGVQVGAGEGAEAGSEAGSGAAGGAAGEEGSEDETAGEDRAASEDWVRFHALWARLRAITGRAAEAAAALAAAEAAGQLPAPHGAKLRRDALEEAGDLEGAAVQARRAVEEERAAGSAVEAIDVLRAVALTAAAGDEPLAAKLLQEALAQTQARLSSAQGEQRASLEDDEKRLREALEEPSGGAPSLVRLGVNRH